MVDDFSVEKNDIIVEIGPGKGALTSPLSEKCQKVIALEIDPSLTDNLRLKSGISNLEVIHCDAGKVDVPELLAAIPPHQGRLLLLGNLPYNRTGVILNNFFRHLNLFDECHFMVQYEVARRMVAESGTRKYGALSLFVANYSRAEITRKIPPEVFRPRPKIFSAMVKFVPLQTPINTDPLFHFFVKKSFSQKRKKIVNSLSSLIDKKLVIQKMHGLGLSDSARAEQLNIDQFSRLFMELSHGLREKMAADSMRS